MLAADLLTPKLELVLRGLTWCADEKRMVAGAGAAWLVRTCSTDRVFVRTADQMLCSVAIVAALPHILIAFVRERSDRMRVGKRRKGSDSFPGSAKLLALVYGPPKPSADSFLNHRSLELGTNTPII